MKRRYIAPAVVLAGVIPFQKEHKNPECKDRTCANERSIVVPEQPHALEELPNYKETPQRMVWVGSPATDVPWGSERHLEHLRINGQTLEKALS